METILQQITSLRRATNEFGPAPHKPILLLAIIESFDKGEIVRNRIEMTDALLTHFYDLWHLLIHTPNSPNFSLSFFHLGNEKRGLWKLITIPGRTIVNNHKLYYKNLNDLKYTIAGAQLSEEFFSAISDPLTRDAMQLALLNTYFPDTTAKFLNKAKRYSKEVEKQILNNYSPNHISHKKLVNLVETAESREEELIVRNYIFRKAVLKTYHNRCAISGFKIESSVPEILVEACHIAPLSLTTDNTIKNGIALTPTLHRAFDSGLIAIDDDYTLLVHPKLKDYDAATGIRQFEHKTILLPNEVKLRPSLRRLAEHRVKFGY